MTFASNYFASKRCKKVERQEFGSTPYKQGIDPWANKLGFAQKLVHGF
jgi:hypothetical protein